MKKPFDSRNIGLVFLSFLCLLFAYLHFFGADSRETLRNPNASEPAAVKETIWTCSMHPAIRQPNPGLCPLCGMDLIPANDDSDDSRPWSLTLSEKAQKLAEIQTAPVETLSVNHEVRMVGKVTIDEKRISNITARVGGRIDRLYVDFTGIEVRKGDHMVEIYSPDLITTQQELRQAKQAVENGPETLVKASTSRLNAARRKLELLGLSAKQIASIEQKNELTTNLMIESAMAGIVIQKHLNEGAYVTTGSPIYTLADLSRVWITLDAYESDLSWLSYGQDVEFEVEAFPGEPFHGRIAFIDPILNPRTRTVKVRLDVPNPDRRLKPDMFVRAVVQARMSDGGKVMAPELAGKWICPMHQEIMKDTKSACDICGMALVKAESLGFVTHSQTPPLAVPASAVLITGKRSVVYVAVPDEPGTYEGREILLGPEAGDFFVVKSGLTLGERVVVNGAFKIDSELQIRAKKSMMYHTSDAVEDQHPKVLVTQTAFRKTLDSFYRAYFQMQDQLSKDQLPIALDAGRKALAALEKVDPSLLDSQGTAFWKRIERSLIPDLNRFISSSDLAMARKAFEPVSGDAYFLAFQFGFTDDFQILRFHCPMAFDNRGAYWLQDHEGTANPYFGASMFACGSQVADLAQERQQALGKAPGKVGGHDH